MIKRVLIVSLSVFVIALILFWLFTGGPAAAWRTARTLINPLDLIVGTSTSGSFIRLPWQTETPVRGPDISDYAAQADAYNQSSGDEDQRSDANGRSDVRTFGNPSPYVGKVSISDSAASESDPQTESIQITASGGNSTPIAITNWSLQSAVSGARYPIPQAAPLFVMGTVNNVQTVRLEPGASALVTTAASPTGVSFRENICTGYLNELQQFAPELSSNCPAVSELLPLNADNLRTYGSTCIDYVGGLPSCHFPRSLPLDLSSACRTFIANTSSYNGCVNMYKTKTSFALPSWRLYLALRSEAWSNSHDVIRLLDEQGRTVDVLTY